MTCPVCGGYTKVINSRADCEGVYRRRRCVSCNYKLYTSEYESDGAELKLITRQLRNKINGGKI